MFLVVKTDMGASNCHLSHAITPYLGYNTTFGVTLFLKILS